MTLLQKHEQHYAKSKEINISGIYTTEVIWYIMLFGEFQSAIIYKRFAFFQIEKSPEE